MTLFNKTQINRDFSQVSRMIYGFPKTGKTTFCSHFISKDGRQPLFIATEDGHSAMEVFAKRIYNWNDFDKLLETIYYNQETIKEEHSCFVIDILSDLDLWLTRHICKENKVDFLHDKNKLGYGKGSAIHKTRFQTAMQVLFKTLPVNFICHSKEREINWQGEKINVQSPSISTATLEFVNGKVDMIGWLSPARIGKQKPKLIFKGSDTCLAGSRFPDLTREFDFDPADPGKAYLEMLDIFENPN